MRKPKENKKEVDLLKPVIIPEGNLEDCFGREYNPQEPDCSICADIEICGIKFQSIIQKKKQEFEETHGPLLDQADFKSVNMAQIEVLVKKYEAEGEPMTHEELREAIAEQARIKDEVAVIEFIKRTIPVSNLILKEGKVYVKREDSNN